mmetsp:Transcript_47993/g.89486  ORF Transcript_47993/g.89486 Transcript_47993/m.89486 type:complete len:344 (-) Transcript_47993:89-1120(-)
MYNASFLATFSSAAACSAPSAAYSASSCASRAKALTVCMAPTTSITEAELVTCAESNRARALSNFFLRSKDAGTSTNTTPAPRHANRNVAFTDPTRHTMKPPHATELAYRSTLLRLDVIALPTASTSRPNRASSAATEDVDPDAADADAGDADAELPCDTSLLSGPVLPPASAAPASAAASALASAPASAAAPPSKNAHSCASTAAMSCLRSLSPTRADTSPRQRVRSHDPTAPTANTPNALTSTSCSFLVALLLLLLLVPPTEEEDEASFVPSMTALRSAGAAALEKELTRRATAPTPRSPASGLKYGQRRLMSSRVAGALFLALCFLFFFFRNMWTRTHES